MLRVLENDFIGNFDFLNLKKTEEKNRGKILTSINHCGKLPVKWSSKLSGWNRSRPFPIDFNFN